jgi:hypothetical protein
MSTITWIPGSNPALDKLFDDLREQQYQDHSHRLWKNYSKNEFKYLNPIALSIYFDDNGEPSTCSSIAARECWPAGIYRIHNRTWKPNERLKMLNSMSPIAWEQAKWLKENTDCQLYFISRSTKYWETWMCNELKKNYNMDFTTDNFFYLTCPNAHDSSCWQKIIYHGDERLLTQWQRKQK